MRDRQLEGRGGEKEREGSVGNGDDDDDDGDETGEGNDQNARADTNNPGRRDKWLLRTPITLI